MLQIIKAEDVLDGEPRWWLSDEESLRLDYVKVDHLHIRPISDDCTHAVVDRPAPTPAPAPGLDIDAAEKRAAGFRGTFRVMSYDSGDKLLEYVSLDRDIGDDVSDVDEIAQFSCDDAVQRAIVDTLNAAPTLIAEVRRLRAGLAEAKRLGLEAATIADGAVTIIVDASVDDDNESPRLKRDLRRILAALEAL